MIIVGLQPLPRSGMSDPQRGPPVFRNSASLTLWLALSGSEKGGPGLWPKDGFLVAALGYQGDSAGVETSKE